jgi:hypothetical protein
MTQYDYSNYRTYDNTEILDEYREERAVCFFGFFFFV